MGREEGDNLKTRQIIYPYIQCTDIFFLKENIGLDKRKVNTFFSKAYSDEINIQ